MWHLIWNVNKQIARHRPAALGLFLALLCAVTAASEVGVHDDLLLLAIRINGFDNGEVVRVLRLIRGGSAVAERHLRSWHLAPPAGERLQVDGESYVRLADMAGVECYIDPVSQTLVVKAPASAFVATSLIYGNEGSVQLTPSRTGGFLNYDLSWQRDGARASSGGLFELGAFNAWGSGIATVLWNNGSLRSGWVRLDTTWNKDIPERMQSIHFGDAISRAGSWGRSVRFGGIQWTTDFATQPGFIVQPQPSMRGEAIVPSTLDVYLNNVRLLQSDVPPGPFDLTNIPVVTGQGELRLVVHDLLGRQQVITQPYYASQQLLKPGLHDFTYEAGLIRQDYGIASANYGRFIVAATDRRGISAGFTRELRAEILNDQQTMGASGVWLLPKLGAIHLGTLSFGVALSRGPDGHGRLLAVGAERQGRDVSISLQAQQADRNFVQLGQLPGYTPRHTLGANVSFPLRGRGFGLSYTQRSTWESRNQRMLSANYSLRLGRLGQLGMYALRNLSDEPTLTIGITLTIPLDARTTLSADSYRQDGQGRSMLQLQRNTPTGEGFGYRLLAGDDEHYLAGATVNSDRMTLTAESAQFGHQTGHRLGVNGGIAGTGGGVFLSRRVDDSFAVVQVADYSGVRVYRDNHEVSRTDEHGLALIPRLRAYQKNALRIEQADLPVEAEVDTLELTSTPALRSGVVVDFPVRRSRNATFRLTDDNGMDLPPGANVRLEGDSRKFPVGFNGSVFVTGLKTHNRLIGEWAGRQCDVELTLAASAEPMPDLGTLTCKAKTR